MCILFGSLLIKLLIPKEKSEQKVADASKNVTEPMIIDSRHRKARYHCIPCIRFIFRYSMLKRED
jgi:hypothetical protein